MAHVGECEHVPCTCNSPFGWGFNVGDSIRLKPNLGGPMWEMNKGLIGKIDEILTNWDKDDMICWDYHISFGGRSYGVHHDDIEAA